MAEMMNDSAYTIPGVSDGGAHTKFYTGGAYTTDFLSWLVRDEGLVTLEEAHLYQFEFEDDSPKRWEDLLCLSLRRFHARSGKRITEFKPRIIKTPDTRPEPDR